MRRCALACAGVRKAARQVRTRREETRRRVRWMPPEGWRRDIGPQWKMRPQRARRTQAGGWTHIRSSGAWNAPTDMMRALGALFAPERPGASPRPRSGAATPMLGDTTQRHQPPHGQRRQPASACPLSVPDNSNGQLLVFARDNWNYREQKSRSIWLTGRPPDAQFAGDIRFGTCVRTR